MYLLNAMRKKRKLLSEQDKLEICRLYCAGEKVQVIANKFDSDPSWIVKITKKHGVHKDKIKRGEQINFRFSPEQDLAITELNLQRKNAKEISDLIGANHWDVKNAIKRLGLKPTSVSELKRVYEINENWMDELDCPEKAIFLGLFFADGCNQNKNNICQVSLHKDDKDYLAKFGGFVTKQPICQFWENMCELRICSKHFSEIMSARGAVPQKSLILKWPEDLPENLEKYFVRGFFEGDGGFIISTQKYKRFQIAFTSTLEFLKSLENIIFLRLGFHGCIVKASKKNNSNTWRLSYGKRGSLKLLGDWMYGDFVHLAMKRKYDIYLDMLNEFSEAKKSSQRTEKKTNKNLHIRSFEPLILSQGLHP